MAGSGVSAQTIVLPLTGTNPAGGGLTFRITQAPTNGFADIRSDGRGNSALFYRSQENYEGTDMVKFIAVGSDGGQSAPATATLTITQLASPTANDVSASGAAGQQFVLPLTGTDPSGGGLTYKITRAPRNGNADIRTDSAGNAALFYSSRMGFSGVDTVKFIAVDALNRRSSPATATLTITGNIPPTANDVRGNGASGERIVLPLGGTDPTGGGLTFTITQAPRNGNASIRTDGKGNSALFYTSNRGFGGLDLVRFVATDSSGAQSNGARATLNIKATALPSANNVAGQGASGQNIVVPLSGADPAGGGLSYAITSFPANGNASIRTDGRGNSALFYRSRAGFVGSDSVQFIATDSLGRRSTPATATLNVAAASGNASGALQSADSGGAS